MNATIEAYESNVRSYCRAFPKTFVKATGSILTAEGGARYIDFFAGAGALNYGHNNPVLKEALVEYVMSDGLVHGLDLVTSAKVDFLETFQQLILAPRKLDYKAMFPGPTGTNAVESAVKLARKVTGRSNVISFTNAFHGMTLGALALSGNGKKRAAAGVALGGVDRMPFDGYMGEGVDTSAYLDRVLTDTSSGVELPAAIIVETIQAEGGINEATAEWLRSVQRVARKHGALFIVDDIQVGCGRTGPFFSFEELGLTPDVVCLSKSLSGYGLPFALTLFHRDLDAWTPGEHNGTFRGHNLAFVTATKALKEYWADDALTTEVGRKAAIVQDSLTKLAAEHDGFHKGRGLIQGVSFRDPRIAGQVSARAFELGVIIETSGAKDEVLKVLAPLTIPTEELEEGLRLVERATSDVWKNRLPQRGRASLPPPAYA